jgi:ADP-heptose:LPS heptosyltransferase
LRRLRFDATVVAFTGERTYLKLKCIPFLLGIPHKLVFNRHYDCFFFSLRKLFSYRLGQHAEAFGVTRVLIVQTWDEVHTRRMLKRLREGEYFNNPQYYLFTRQDTAAAFADDTQLAQILTYPSDAGLLDYWKSLRGLRRLRFDAAVVAFTEEPSYSKLKWVPFLAGIPSKLVFNRHYDCFFFTAARFLRYWVQRYTGPVGSFRSSIPRLLWSLFLPLLRCFLFPLRFFYLVTAVTWRRLRRAYNSQQ